jgi:hypothetical protein
MCSSTTIPVGQRRRFGDVLEQPIWEVEHQPVHFLAEPFRASPPGYR